MKDNETKIKNQLDELNKESGVDVWTTAQGFHAITAVTKEGDGFQFNPASGIIVKAFINKNTGEIRVFHYLMMATE